MSAGKEFPNLETSDRKPTEKSLHDDGHWRRDCPQYTGGGVFAAVTAKTVLAGNGVQVPHAILVCACGVVKILPLG